MPSCPRCGAQQPERTAFCSTCGALIDRPDTEAVDKSRTVDNSAEQPRSVNGPDANARPLPDSVVQGSPLPKADVSRPQRRSEAAPSAPLPAKQIEFGDVGIYIVRRFLALIIDLVGVGWLIGIALIAVVDGRQAQPDQYLALHARDFAIVLGASMFAYLTLAEALVGSTVGKGLFGLGVGRFDGGRLGLGRAIVRNVLLPLDLALIGFLVAAVTKRRCRIGDLVAGSVVTNARLGRISTVLAAAVSVGAAWIIFGNADGARLSSQLFALTGLRAPIDQGRPVPIPTIDRGSPLPSPQSTI
jgi:uncharacterized RDD family membrane protein YckC